MNKSQLIDEIAEKAGITKSASGRVLEAFTATVTEVLSAGGEVIITNFGNFTVRDRAERTGRNPQTGKEITIPASKVPGFRPGKALKDAVN